MGDEEYNRKMESLQQYIPFLNNMIVQLKDPRKKNREQQLTKMMSLHSMITDKKKKLKLETLIKCEDVILKLYDKVKSGSQQSQIPLRPPPPPTIGALTTESPLSPITPYSPSPPRDIPITKPVVIPTEKVVDRDSQLFQPTSSFKAKIDVYSSAADSLKSKMIELQMNVLEQLGKKVPDMSKPPISLEDLEALQEENIVDTEKMSLNELTDLREKLQKQLSKSEDSSNESIPNLPADMTVRNSTVVTNKAVEKPQSLPEVKSKTPESKPLSKSPSFTVPSTSSPTKPVKVIKEAASIFGSTLSSIDNKLLENACNRIREKERRNSIGQKKEGSDNEKHKERRNSKDDKKDSSSPKDKEKSEKRSSSEHKSKDKKDEKSNKDKKDEKKEKSKDDSKKHHDKSKKEQSSKDNKDKRKEDDKCKESPKSQEKDKSDDKDKPKTETAQVYKRLADKYNPKPRKHNVESNPSADVPKNVSESIENSMKNTPVIPFLDSSSQPQQTPLRPLLGPQPLLNVPLLSPTSSTNSMDSEVAFFNKKPNQNMLPGQQIAVPPLLSNPQVQPQIPPLLGNSPQIPTHVSNILSNPNVTTIINNVVNQFKGAQPPLLPNPLLIPQNQNNFMPNNQPHFGNNMNFNKNQGLMMPQSGGNYWGSHNQPQNHYPPQQRSFTPLPSQYENQMQPLDYYPQGSTTPNPYGHQPPPLLSPQYDTYDTRPPPQRHDRMMQQEENLFGNKDRDMRYRESVNDWRRAPHQANQWQSREPVRDPSRDLHEASRDPRIHRDPRGFRDDPRNYRRDSREYDRPGENVRSKFRDPRLNRYSAGGGRYEREQTPARSRSKSVTRETEETATFASPLDSLYSGNEGYRKTGKGYGMQNFKIPKIKRDAEPEIEKEDRTEALPTESEVKSPEPKESEPKAVESKPESSSASTSTTVETSTEKVESRKEIDENVASASVSSSTECESKKSKDSQSTKAKENESEGSKEPEVGEISSTNDIQSNESITDSKINDQTEIINKFLKKLLENERTRAAASLFIDNVSNSLDDEKLKMVVQTVKSAAVEEEPEEKPKTRKKKLKVIAKRKQQQALKRNITLRRTRRRIVKPVIDDDEEDDDEQEDEEKIEEEKPEQEEEEKKEEEEEEKQEEKKEVLVSVGERTKNRKRVVPAPAAPKKKKAKHRTELDLLHEDIQDMFIRDGVLTATGKRMCRLLKNEAETSKPPVPEPRTRRTRATAEKSESKSVPTSPDKIKAMSNVRVLIPKISVDKLTEVDEDGQRYSLRRSNKAGKSYVEQDSDEEKEKEKKKVAEEKAEAENVEEEKVPQEVKEKEAEKEVVPKKTRKRTRGGGWASGVILKRKRKEVSREEEKTDEESKPEENENIQKTKQTEGTEKTEEADKSLELVEPDKNYYSCKRPNVKTPCKLCSFRGKNITLHYRIKHPESEVLSSRLSPTKAEQAIKLSKEIKLDDNEDEKIASTRRYDFKCCFCDVDMHSKTSSFYDHISTHTGEYRHTCDVCSFGSCSIRPLKTHYLKVHGKPREGRACCIRTKVYGYICLECNFVQINKKSVENHVNIYHLGEGKKIMKIYLSSLDHLTSSKDETAEPAALENEEKSEDEEKRDTNEDVQVKKKKLDDEEPSLEDEPLAKRKKMKEQKDLQGEKEEVKQDSIKKEKEIDMTVFTCNTDIQEENEKIEQERLKKMAELSESVRPNRQSLNFIEQLSNRLLQEEKEQEQEIAAPEMVMVKNEPMDLEPELEPMMEAEPEPVAEPELEPQPQPILSEVSPRKPFKVMEPPASTSIMQVVQKDNVKIQGMIQKLQGILKEEKICISEGPPPLTPLVEKRKDDLQNVLSAGFLNIVKHEDSLEYACRVPSCLFWSKDRDRFLTHWSEDHTRINTNYKMTKCKICQCEISSSLKSSLLLNFFLHVEEEHLGPRKNILRTRRLSGDKLSTTKELTANPPAKETASEVQAKEEPDIKLDDNPFPFKISGVMSLAEDPVPPLSPIREKSNPKIESLVLKEAKLTPAEKGVAWKCAEAMKKFLQCPRELYKCPQFFCKFATNWRNLFDSHIKAHAAVSDELVCCVYCEVKTPSSHAGLHIDLRHSNCLYSCSQCLYRSLRREYVMVHMKLKHKESDMIISLPPKTAKTIMMSKQKRFSIKEACPPYKCGFKGCVAEFFYQSEYCFHLDKVHRSIMVCGYKLKQQVHCGFTCLMAENMIDHWRSHHCYRYHCLICKFGGMELYTMLEHYSLTHPNMDPLVVDRTNGPLGSVVYGYTEEAFSHAKFLNDELLDSISSQQYTIISSDKKPSESKAANESSPKKNLTIVPLSIIQDGVSTKLFTALATKESQIQPATAQPSFVFASIPDVEGDIKEKEPDEGQKEDETRLDDVDNQNDASNDPLSLDGESTSTVLASGDESDSQDVSDAAVVLKNYGLIGYQLYRCAFCDISFSNARDFKNHCMHSKLCREATSSLKQFKCVHCGRLFKNPHGLLEHIQYHGQLRFCCSLCVKKFPSSFSLKLHMRTKHNVTNTVMAPLIPNKTNVESDEFVLRPVPVSESEAGKEGQNSQNAPSHKTVFSPEEIDQLPNRHIFNSDVKCALCPYSTKVRTNLLRHLQFHSAEKSVPEIAPVNPVPCLDKNEKMFDKMTNLAISSFTGTNTGRMGGVKPEPKEKEQVQLPAYIPSHRRYVCCAQGCNYLCLEEANLRHHLYALHVQEPSFTCAHCKVNLKTDIEGYLKHLKLHDLHLYKCGHCPFVHNLRHKVGKHCTDRHPEKIQRTITIRALEAEIVDVDQSSQQANVPAVTETPAPSNIKWTKPWHCGMCKYRCAAKNDILGHIFNKHDINTQYKCTLCSYKTNEKNTFEDHFKENHPDNDIDIIHVYYKSEGMNQSVGANQSKFDTTPLWQRDRPRVRHIRGILFEETSPQKETKKKAGGSGKSFGAPSTSTSNLDLAIEAVAKGVDEATKILEDTLSLENLKPSVPLSEESGDKSKVDETVIVIDDDDDEDIAAETTLELEDEESELLIDIDSGTSIEENVKKELEEGLLSEEILINKYGKLGSPVAKAFRCPICYKFRTKKIPYFVYHLLLELKCNRFKCKSCDYSCITFDNMVVHCQTEHNCVITANVEDTPVEKTVEYWLQLVIKYQARALLDMVPIQTGEENMSATCKTQCEFCQRWFRSIHVLKDHELHHWSDQMYNCGHCCSEHGSLNEAFQHNFLHHSKYEISVRTNGPQVSKIIATLKSPPVTAPQPGSSGADETLYSCLHCSETDKSLEALQKHHNDCHKNENEEFQYKVLSKAKVEVMYCCTYCHERGSDESLKKHHQEKHVGLKFSIYQYICMECSSTFLNIKDLRSHYTKVHPAKKLTYACVENKPFLFSNDVYSCTKCPFRSCSAAGIRSHIRKHLRPVDCLLCGATFIYPTEGRAHHNKEHLHNVESVEENKERLKEYEELCHQIIAAKERVEKPPPRPSPPRRMLARKSTGAPFVREYSYYGAKKDEVDLKGVSTTIE